MRHFTAIFLNRFFHNLVQGSAFSYFEATRRYLEQYGKPVAFYSDKASIFRSGRYETTSGTGATAQR